MIDIELLIAKLGWVRTKHLKLAIEEIHMMQQNLDSTNDNWFEQTQKERYYLRCLVREEND